MLHKALATAAILTFIILATTQLPAAQNAPVSLPTQLKATDIDKMMTDLSNWGRWGKDDQRGTLNLITPAKRKQAAGLLREGISVSLAHDFSRREGC